MKRSLSIVTCFILLLSATAVFSQASTAIVHTAGVANITLNWTSIDNGELNGDAAAVIITTPNWNPPGSAGVYFPYNSGVWYDFNGKWAVFTQDYNLGMTDGASFNVWIAGDDVTAYVHTATVGNLLQNVTYLDNPALNGNPNAIFFVDQNYGPLSVYNDQSIGIWYDVFESKWGIFNQDYNVNMPEGASFNVLIPSDDYGAFVHTASVDNISSNWTYLDHPKLNGHPEAIITITSNWNPPGSSGVYLDQPLGVWYDEFEGKWGIFNQDYNVNMVEGASFNVLVYQDLTSVAEVAAPGSLKAYPNPVGEQATVSFELTESADVNASVYDLEGRLVAVLADGTLGQGKHSLLWNAGDAPSGLYFCRLLSENGLQTIKLNHLR